MSKNNKILVVSELFWPEGGGAELATYLILRILCENNFEVHVVTGTKNPVPIKCVRYYYTSLLGKHHRVEKWLRIWLLLRQQWFRRLLEKNNVTYLPLLAYPVIPVAKKMHKRVLVHLHNYSIVRYPSVKYYFEKDILSPIEELRIGFIHELCINKSIKRAVTTPISYSLYLLEKEWVEQIDKVICVSYRQAEIVMKNMPIVRNKIEIVYNPPPLLEDIEKRVDLIPTYLYVGGDNRLKGFHILLKAIVEFLKGKRKAKFIFTNKYSKKVLKIINRINRIHGNVIYLTGRISYEEIYKLHGKIWALIFPSIWEEPLPYAVMEAAFLGTIPIASRVGGIPEIVAHTPAEHFLFDSADVDTLVNLMDTIASMDRESLLDISFKLRRSIIQRFNAEKVKYELLRIFQE